MRILLLTTASRFTPDVQLLVHLVAALGARGEVVGVACVHGSEVDRGVSAAWPRLTLRTFSAGGTTRHASGVREVISALRPDAVLVGSEADAALASVAMRGRGGVVRRVAFGERGEAAQDRGGWRLGFGTPARVIDWGRRMPAVSWPGFLPDEAQPGADGGPHHDAHHDGRDDARNDAQDPQILVLPPIHREGVGYDEGTAAALRTVAHLRRRHHTLRITLLGDAPMLQTARVHAASLDLTEGLAIRPVQALLNGDVRAATALWIATSEDAAAICAVAGMQQGVPAVVPHDAPFAGLVLPGISGFVVAETSFSVAAPGNPAQHPSMPVSLVTELAKLIGDPFVRRAMGDAALGRAARDHAWEHFVDEAQVQLAHAAGDRARSESRETKGGSSPHTSNARSTVSRS